MMEKEESFYRERTRTSSESYKRAQKILPGGVGGSAPYFEPYPFFIERAKGSRVWDVDGNEYCDYNLCWGVLMGGHSHPIMADGLKRQLEKGTMYGFPHENSRVVAEEIKKRFPVDKVRFTNSGSESTFYAVRLARSYTGKDKIVKIEGAYNGVADALHISKKPEIEKVGPSDRPASVPHGKGIPQGVIDDTLIAPFNDLDVMEDVLREYREEVAAVIVEPVMMNKGVIPPEEGYLEGLRKLTEEDDVLLIFDEVKTGVKIASGGACEYYGVKPDIVALAKAIGGGLPIGAVAGDGEMIEGVGEEGLFGTYSSNPLSVEACRITLQEILTADAYTSLEKMGKQLMSGYRDVIKDMDLEAVVQGVNAVGGILFTDRQVKDFRDWTKVDKEKAHKYWISMVNRGVIPMSYGADEEWLISVKHTKEDIEEHIEVFKDVANGL